MGGRDEQLISEHLAVLEKQLVETHQGVLQLLRVLEIAGADYLNLACKTKFLEECQKQLSASCLWKACYSFVLTQEKRFKSTISKMVQ